MSIIEFIEKIVGHIAWPAALVILALNFRNEIRAFLKRIKTAKYKDMELDLGEEIQAVKQEAEDYGITIMYPASTFNPDLVNQMQTQPEWAFIQSWQEIEQILTQLYRQQTGNQEQRISTAEIITMLKSEYIISPDLADLTNKIRLIRNKLIHSSESEITRGEALEWLGISRSVQDRLAQRLKP